MSSSVRLSVCLSSVVCNVRAPYSGYWNFRQCFYALWYLGHPWPLYKNFTEFAPGETLRHVHVRNVRAPYSGDCSEKSKRGSQTNYPLPVDISCYVVVVVVVVVGDGGSSTTTYYYYYFIIIVVSHIFVYIWIFITEKHAAMLQTATHSNAHRSTAQRMCERAFNVT